MESILKKKQTKRKEIKQIDDDLLTIERIAKQFRVSPFWTIQDYKDCCAMIKGMIVCIGVQIEKLEEGV